jgi:hypothetical protein
MTPEAAIVNLYEGGKGIMGLHQDVSEEVRPSFISIMILCKDTCPRVCCSDSRLSSTLNTNQILVDRLSDL